MTDLRSFPADPNKSLSDLINDLVQRQQEKIEETRRANEVLRSTLSRIVKHCEDMGVILALPGGSSARVVNATDVIDICNGAREIVGRDDNEQGGWRDPEKGVSYGE